jgi:phage terminase Nu1 subunit (DNA packaging protein)
MAGDGKFDVKTIAGLLMIDERRIQQLVKEGWIPRGERGRYALIPSVQGYIRSIKEGQRETGRGGEQARLARANALKVEMENYRRMGELIVKEQSDETTAGLVVMIKSSHEGLPGRLANELAGLEPPRIYQRLQTELRAILTQCADYLSKRADALGAMPEPSEDDPAVAAADPDDVGRPESGDAAG